jgi:aminoglycoside 3-N-acetyltransferase
VPWRFYKKFTGEYTDHNSNKNIKTYLGYVRKLDKGIVTTLDPAGELLWNRNLFYGHRPFEKSGIRYVYSQDYYNLFEELLEKRMSDPYYYTVESN